VNVLVLGMEGAGKTLLLKRLSADTKLKSKRAKEEKFSADVISTAGVEFVEVPLGKKDRIVFRELGGCMLPLWPTYYSGCDLLVWVVDVGNPATMATSAVQLYKMLEDPSLKGKPTAVVLNKCDQPSVLPRHEVNHIFMLRSMTQRRPWVQVVEASAWSGQGSSDILSFIAAKAGLAAI